MQYTARSPAKLILSGEHAVLYGCPALSLAIDLPTECRFILDANESTQFDLQINLLNYTSQQAWKQAEWQSEANQVQTRYAQYQAGQIPIQKVCAKPTDLLLLCFDVFFCEVGPLASAQAVLSVESKSWMGRGLGSSAAVIVSVLSVLAQAYRAQTGVDVKDRLFDLARRIESFQHGRSSGLDPATIRQGGLIRYQLDQPLQALPLPNLNGWLVDTGAPESATGACVDWVRSRFADQSGLWREFAECTESIQQACLNGDTRQLGFAIQQNQRLLQRIGVVPNRVVAFIERLAELGLSAKVCGAGAIAGDAAGVVLAVGEANPQALCERYGYRCQSIH